MSSPVSGVAVTFVPTSADEAISMTGVMSNAEAAFQAQVARARLESALTFISGQYERLKSLGVRLVDRISQTQTPVTASSLASAPKTESALRKIFSDDGPNLGASLSEANSLYNDVLSSGLNLNAPISTPVLIERFDGNGKLLATGFSWESESAVSLLSQLPSGSNNPYPGSNVRETVTRDDKGKVAETTRITIFSSYSTRRSAAGEISAAISSVNTLIDKTSDILKAELVRAAKSLNDVERLSLQSIQFQNESTQSINQVRTARFEQREDVLRRERIIRRERDLKGIQFESTSGIPLATSTVQRDAENAIPVSPVDESEAASGSERSRNFDLTSSLRAMQGSNPGSNFSAELNQAGSNNKTQVPK